MYLSLREKLAHAISDAAGVQLNEALASIEIPKGQFGDVASSICFLLAKLRKKSPNEIAKEICGKIQIPSEIREAKPEGAYINFILSDFFFSSLLETVMVEGSRYGAGKAKEGKTIVEFPSVNPNKPWHIGHLRNALLGDSVARLLEFAGERVERIDYIDDLGLQIAQTFWGYANLGKRPEGKLDLWLGKQYVEVSRRFESDEKVQAEVRTLLKEMEQGRGRAEECRALVEECVKAQYETAFKFGIRHDALIFESDIVRTVFEEGMGLLKKNQSIVAEKEGKNAGCLVAKMQGKGFDGMESPDKVLVRSDGTATYTGKDLIFHLWKFGLLKNDFKYFEFAVQPDGTVCFKTDSKKGRRMPFGKATKVINVIGTEQIYPQKVIREVLFSMGHAKEAESLFHLSYEHVWLEDSKFSGREGTWLGYTADELYAEGVRRAEGKIRQEISGEERKRIAEAVAASAIRFAMIKTTPEKKIVFRWEDALSLEGDSAPYAIYAHARAHKIFEKGGRGKSGKAFEPAEKELLKKVMLLEYVVSEAAAQHRPNIVAEYCLDLAFLYNKFYNSCPILSCPDESAREGRLATNYAAMVALKNSLMSIGILPLERM